MKLALSSVARAEDTGVIWVGFRHTKGVIFHNNVSVHVKCYYREISDMTECLAVIPYASADENVEYETRKETKKQRS